MNAVPEGFPLSVPECLATEGRQEEAQYANGACGSNDTPLVSDPLRFALLSLNLAREFLDDYSHDTDMPCPDLVTVADLADAAERLLSRVVESDCEANHV